MHREQIALDDSRIAHRHAAHPQKIVGARGKEVGIDLNVTLHVLFGEHWAARRDAADDRQLEEAPLPAGGLAVAHPDAARGARGNVDRALLFQRAQVLLGGVDRAKAHALGDLGPGGGVARHLGQLADQLQNLRLSFCKGIH